MFLFAAPNGATPVGAHEIAEAIWVPFHKVGMQIGNKTDRFWFASIASRVKEALQRD